MLLQGGEGKKEKKKRTFCFVGFLLARQVFRSVMCSDPGQDFTFTFLNIKQTHAVFLSLGILKAFHLNLCAVFFCFFALTEVAWGVKLGSKACVFTVSFTGWLFTGCQQENCTLTQPHIKLSGYVFTACLFTVRCRVFPPQSLLISFEII